MTVKAARGSIIQDTRGWPGLLLRWVACTAFFWVLLWAFSWPTAKHNLITVKGTVTSYTRKPGTSSMGGSPEQATYVVRSQINGRDYFRTVWINVGKLEPKRKPELPQLVGREIEAKTGFGDEVYGLSVGRDPVDSWFTADAVLAAKWANFLGSLKVSGGIALFMALITSLDVFRRKPLA
jgi:hypothetical protein